MNYWEKLFHTFSIVCGTSFLIAFSGVAEASQRQHAVFTVTSVTPLYETVVNQQPVQSCRTVDVPIYQQKDKTGDILGGAIIGGIIGNQIGDMKGNGAAGAVIGGLLGANKDNNQAIIGYRQTQQCTTEYVRENVERLRGYKVVAEGKGLTYTTVTKQKFSVGDGMAVYITVTR